MAALLGTALRAGASAAGSVDWKSVGQRALAHAKNAAPEAANAAQAYLNRATGGEKTIDQLAGSKSPVTQMAVVKALLVSGMTAVDFAEVTQLTGAERKMYSGLIAKYRELQFQAVDAHQTIKPTTGEAYLDRLAVNVDIKANLTLLSISSDEYARLIRGFNSHTSKDVEMFQLDRSVRQERFM